MPQLTKEALSRYVRTGCKRQLRLYLTPDNRRFAAEREREGMPPIQPPRPGLQQIVNQGDDWQTAKVSDLTGAFGADAIIGNSLALPGVGTTYSAIELQEAVAAIGQGPGYFIVEGQFAVGPSFENGLGIAHLRQRFGLEYGALRPDLIEVAAPGTFADQVLPTGEVVPLAATDPRLQLRVIDIKLTAEPSASYMLEVALYTIALAGWLIDQGLDDRYTVASQTAVWPGSHDAANLTVQLSEWERAAHHPTFAELQDALAEDLEEVPFEVFALRLGRLLREDVAEVLAENWRELPWHVDNTCKGCEYLGAPWISQGLPTWNEDHCRPEAERAAHLSQVAFVGRGASAALRDAGVSDVRALAGVSSDDAVFDSHQTLRATRTVVARRAGTIDVGEPGTLAPDSGTSAIMPRWADLRISLSVDFDPGSAITFAFGLKGFWLEPRQWSAARSTDRQNRVWAARSFIVDQRSVAAEERELLNWLEAINSILDEARALDPETTVQFYLWDQLEAKHLARVIGRHLDAILNRGSLQYLAWLFPPDELLPNPKQSTRRSPITVVRDVVRAVVAAPIAHYYALLPLARTYYTERLPENLRAFRVHPLFEDYLGDQIPAERAHEIWSRSTRPPWLEQMNTLQETVSRRLQALESVRDRLELDLRPVLGQWAPRINVQPPDWQARLSADSQLWYAYAKLNEALAELEVHQVRAMPPHEREARFHSARLTRRLRGQEEREALESLGVAARSGRRVYELAPGSREIKAREGDFDFAIAPAGDAGFLDRSLFSLVRGTSLADDLPPWRTPLDQALGVTIVAIDRERGLLAFDPNTRSPVALDDLEAEGLIDLETDAILDPTHADFFTKKLRLTLHAIGNPDIARDNPAAARALGRLGGRRARRTAHTPPADVLWDAAAMHATRVTRPIAGARTQLDAHNMTLNDSQWRAWEEALTRRLQLIWGPPGTGKSRTMRAVGAGAVLSAIESGQPLRVLVCASTYTAVDNVLLTLNEELDSLVGGSQDLVVGRLRSYSRAREADVPEEIDVELSPREPSEAVRALRQRLEDNVGVTLIGSTPMQVHNLLTLDDRTPQHELFDLILFDEATQTDVAHATLALAALAAGGSVVVAGDPLQLPPIAPAEPPQRLEAFVGSFYSFLRDVHGIEQEMLEENYRSNRAIVAFCRRAGYRDALTSYSPDLALTLDPVSGRPADWPESLPWFDEYEQFIDPARPAVCFVYPDARASQWNRFEADTVAALSLLLRKRLHADLSGELDAAGHERAGSGAPHDDASFWERGVGIVTPHRAQQGLIISRLQHVFEAAGPQAAAIRGAVDTVERFQGQQRDVIIASFALGDPDAIRDEEEFLLSLNRFNVMASRARAKLITLVSRDVVDHLPNDIDVVRASRLLKVYVDSFCNQSQTVTLGFDDDGGHHPYEGQLRWHE